MRILATALLMLTAFAGCARLPTSGAANARLDAAQVHIGPCARSLAGDSLPDARRDCLPVLVIVGGD
jgi:hypothetical protein